MPPRSTHATYHPGGYGVSEGLKRARAPYRIRNAVTGSLILGFVTAVYLYSISKVSRVESILFCSPVMRPPYSPCRWSSPSRQVKQDDFSDLADVRATNTDTEPETNAAPAHGHKV